MVVGGNLLTHYNYHKCEAALREGGERLEVHVRTRDGRGDLDVAADRQEGAVLPPGSPFADWREARRFAGPLPWTFDYEVQTRSIVRIKGVREHWEPRPVALERVWSAFLEGPAFGGARPVLASAFHTRGIDYRWERGVREPIAGEAA